MRSEKVSYCFTRIIYAFAALLFCGIPLVFLLDRAQIMHPVYHIAAGVLFAAAAVFAAFLLSRFGGEIRTKDGVLAAIVAAVCFAVKLIVVLRWRVDPLTDYDYGTFYSTAKDLASTGQIEMHRYVALFPHIYGYSAFLSIFYRIFGTGVLVAPILNAVLSAAGAALLYLLVRRFGCKRTALAAALLWTICPSQTFFNIYVLSEPYYTTMLFGAMLLADVIRVRIKDGTLLKEKQAQSVFALLGIGVLLGLTQTARPIAVIPIIAMAGTLLCIDLPYRLRGAAERVAVLLVIVLVMSGVTTVMHARLNDALGEPAASGVGYSYAVGLSEDTGGKWSYEVSGRLTEYIYKFETADEVQRQFMEDVKELIRSGEIDWFPLVRVKYSNFLMRDDAAVAAYGGGVYRHVSLFSVACNGFWLACALFAAFGAVMAFLRKERSVMLLTSLYAIGLTLAQMLVEVAYRYHYSMYIAIIPLAVYGLRELADMFSGRRKHG